MANPSAESSSLSAPTALVREVATKLLEHDLTVAFAESCTGGRVSAMIATFPGISPAFLGSVVSYADSAKQTLLGVSAESLGRGGAVSAEVALQMARGVQLKLGADWAVSITGIAGPGGGSKEKPIGLVFFGIVGPGVEDTAERHFEGDRTKIQQAAADHALSWLSLYLGETKGT